MQIPRSRERIAVEIPVIITTVLDSVEGMIVDLSEGGAQITGCSLPPKSQCQIDLDGHTVFGTVRWAEEDRMGIRFPFLMTDGPLFEKLEMARAARRAPIAFRPHAPQRVAAGGGISAGLVGAGLGGGGFGRRRG
jgi:hypothetical protein